MDLTLLAPQTYSVCHHFARPTYVATYPWTDACIHGPSPSTRVSGPLVRPFTLTAVLPLSPADRARVPFRPFARPVLWLLRPDHAKADRVAARVSDVGGSDGGAGGEPRPGCAAHAAADTRAARLGQGVPREASESARAEGLGAAAVGTVLLPAGVVWCCVLASVVKNIGPYCTDQTSYRAHVCSAPKRYSGQGEIRTYQVVSANRTTAPCIRPGGFMRARALAVAADSAAARVTVGSRPS